MTGKDLGYFAAGFTTLVLAQMAWNMWRRAGDQRPAAQAGREFYRLALQGTPAVRLHAMRTVEGQKPTPFFEGWAASVRMPTDEIRKNAAEIAEKHGVRLLTYNALDGETYVFVA